MRPRDERGRYFYGTCNEASAAFCHDRWVRRNIREWYHSTDTSALEDEPALGSRVTTLG